VEEVEVQYGSGSSSQASALPPTGTMQLTAALRGRSVLDTRRPVVP